MAPSRRTIEGVIAVQRRQVDPGSGLQEVPYGGLFLGRREWFLVIDVELFESGVEIDVTFVDVDTVVINR